MKESEIIVLCSKVLVAYDGLDLGQKALEKAIELANFDHAIKIEVIYVVAIPELPHIVLDNIQDIEDVLYREGQEIMAQAQISLFKISNYSQIYLLNGSPAQLILNHAKEYQCDLTIM